MFGVRTTTARRIRIPGFIDHVANKRPEVVRVYLPPDANTLLSVADHCLRSRHYVNVIVAGKQPALTYLDMDSAIAHCTRGLGIWEWASNATGEPDVVLACAGDIPTLETLAAADILRRELPDLAVRVVNVVDIMRLQPDTEHPHGLSRPRVRCAVHHRQAGHLRLSRLSVADSPADLSHGPITLQLHVRGFKERGTTTTPFDMVMLNDLDRFHLVLDVIDRVDGLANRAAVLRQRMLDARLAARRYTREHGEDDPADLRLDLGRQLSTAGGFAFPGHAQRRLSRPSPGRLDCCVRPSRGSRASAPAGRAAFRTAPLPHLRRHRRGCGRAGADQSRSRISRRRGPASRPCPPPRSACCSWCARVAWAGPSSGWAVSTGNRAPATRWPRLRLVMSVIAIGALLPWTRPMFMNNNYATISGALIASMMIIPLQTVIPEELAFRGVLHGALNRAWGFRGVAAAGSLLFGLWHIATSLGLTSSNVGFTRLFGGGLLGTIAGVVLAVAATAVAGFRVHLAAPAQRQPAGPDRAALVAERTGRAGRRRWCGTCRPDRRRQRGAALRRRALTFSSPTRRKSRFLSLLPHADISHHVPPWLRDRS